MLVNTVKNNLTVTVLNEISNGGVINGKPSVNIVIHGLVSLALRHPLGIPKLTHSAEETSKK